MSPALLIVDVDKSYNSLYDSKILLNLISQLYCSRT
jgi:hypothetical protein